MLFNSYIVTCLGFQLGKNTLIAKSPSHNPSYQLKSHNPPRFPTSKSEGEKGLGLEFFIRFKKERYKGAGERISPQLGKRKGDLRRDEEGEDGDLVGDHELRWWPQGRKILLLK